VSTNLRPLERRVLAMRDAGHEVPAIAEAFRRSPEHIERIIGWTEIPRSGPPERRYPRALEERVLSLRHSGETHEQIAERFRSSPGFVKRIEGLAHYRRALEILRD
jgi:hypothetical protein